MRDRHSGGLIQASHGLLEARNVILGHDMRIARRDATLTGRICVDALRSPVRVDRRAGRRRRFPRGHHCNLTRLAGLSFSTHRVRICGECDTAKRTAQTYC
jgi:hypothetical protein